MTLGYWIPLIGWMLTIFILSSIPGRNIPHVSVLGFDKVAHIFIYGILGLFLIRAFFSATDIGLVKSVLLSIIIGALFGMSDEWHQSFVPGRNMDLFDFFADFIGLSVGVFLRCKGKWYAGN
ncbi:MAG: VanZ family protein [Candidatus Omnitrophota bacterium]|jgi:VanZ family protein